MPTNDVSSLRKSALALHALSSQDMARVWQRLDESRRSSLSPLLDELDSLGIPKGRRWLEEDLLKEDASLAISQDSSPQALRDAVAGLSPEQALARLQSQSVDTVATVMRIAPWPWNDAVAQAWAPESRHLLRRRLDQPGAAIPPRLAEPLLRSMLDAGLSATMPPVGAPSASASTPSRRHRPWYQALLSLFLIS